MTTYRIKTRPQSFAILNAAYEVVAVVPFKERDGTDNSRDVAARIVNALNADTTVHTADSLRQAGAL